MPVNFLYIFLFFLVLILAYAIWFGVFILLHRWRPGAGVGFLGLSAALLAVHVLNTNVEIRHNEEMAFQVAELGDGLVVSFTTNRGDVVTLCSTPVTDRLRTRIGQTILVSMVGWYDFGRLKKYRILEVDGIKIRDDRLD